MQAVAHRRDITQHPGKLIAPLDLDGLRQVATGNRAHTGARLGKSPFQATQGRERGKAASQNPHHRQHQVRQQGRAIALLGEVVCPRSRFLLQRLQLAQFNTRRIASRFGHAQERNDAGQPIVTRAQGLQQKLQLTQPRLVMAIEGLGHLLLMAGQGALAVAGPHLSERVIVGFDGR